MLSMLMFVIRTVLTLRSSMFMDVRLHGGEEAPTEHSEE